MAETLSHKFVLIINVSTMARRIKNEITNGIFTFTCVTVSETGSDQWNGDIKQFDDSAENLISGFWKCTACSDGAVTDIYLCRGKWGGKIDLLMIKTRGRISCYARDNHIISIYTGPFELKQGSYGMLFAIWSTWMMSYGQACSQVTAGIYYCYPACSDIFPSIRLQVLDMSTGFETETPWRTLIKPFTSQIIDSLSRFLMILP